MQQPRDFNVRGLTVDSSFKVTWH